MNLHRLVIHEIIKSEGQTGMASIVLSDDMATNDAQAITFVTELNNRYRNLRQSNGKFRDATMAVFPNHFADYYNDNVDEAFITFTKNAVSQLQGIISASAPAKGGYIIFADYFETQHFISVFLIRNKAGNSLQKKKSDTTYTINETIHIDFEHLAMACRINKNLYTTSSGSYLTFINKRNIDSNFFITWICAEDLINNAEDTKNLLKILKQIDPPIDERGQPMSQIDFINAVYTFIKDAPRGSFTDLKQIGSRFYDDENKLTNFAQDENIILNHLFKPDAGTLRQFVNIKVKADSIDMIFPQQYLDDKKVELFEDDGKIVIKSTELIEKIKAEMIVGNG